MASLWIVNKSETEEERERNVEKVWKMKAVWKRVLQSYQATVKGRKRIWEENVERQCVGIVLLGRLTRTRQKSEVKRRQRRVLKCTQVFSFFCGMLRRRNEKEREI